MDKKERTWHSCADVEEATQQGQSLGKMGIRREDVENSKGVNTYARNFVCWQADPSFTTNYDKTNLVVTTQMMKCKSFC